MTKLAPEWVRTSDPVIRSPARYRWTTAPAFHVIWGHNYVYLFPPFSLIAKTLQKVRADVSEAIMIAPIWPTQVWFCQLMELLIDIPRILPLRKDLLTLPGTHTVHPLYPNLTLMACRLSGDHSKNKTFQLELPKSFLDRGDIQRKSNTRFISTNGFCSVTKGKLIQFIPL